MAQAAARKDQYGLYADQFNNLDNTRGHYEETGPEIYEQMKGNLDVFVMGSGTGATISGVSNYLKRKRGLKTSVILADVNGSSLYNWVKYDTLYTGEDREGHKLRKVNRTIIEGTGLNWLCENTSRALIDDAEKVTDQEAYTMAKYMLKNEGILIGSTTAVNLVATVKHLRRNNLTNKKALTIACDDGFNHMSKFYSSSQWKAEGFKEPSNIEIKGFMDLTWITL
jgi:cysteine synthase